MQAVSERKTPSKTRSAMKLIASSSRAPKTKLTPIKEIGYKALRNAGVTPALAKNIVDIPENTHMSTGTIEQQREKALKALNLTIHSQLKTLVEIRDDKQKTPASDRISAVKTINTMIPGFTAPAEVKVNHTAVMMEFSSLSSQDLAQLADILHVNTSVSNRCTDVTEDTQVIDSIEDSNE
jgi:hypothetical protein